MFSKQCETRTKYKFIDSSGKCDLINEKLTLTVSHFLNFRPEETGPVDYQVPQVKEGPSANVTLHSDRLTKFEEKKTPSLGGASSASSSAKPAIVFRKRKINSEGQKKFARRRDEDD